WGLWAACRAAVAPSLCWLAGRLAGWFLARVLTWRAGESMDHRLLEQSTSAWTAVATRKCGCAHGARTMGERPRGPGPPRLCATFMAGCCSIAHCVAREATA